MEKQMTEAERKEYEVWHPPLDDIKVVLAGITIWYSNDTHLEREGVLWNYWDSCQRYL